LRCRRYELGPPTGREAAETTAPHIIAERRAKNPPENSA
jgi:hypothetical protein